MMRVPSVIRSAVLTAGAILGVICMLWTFALLIAGITPLVVLSGSMSPALQAGDVAFARSVPADEIAPGDIVSVVAESGTRITHRVTDVTSTGESDEVTLTLKGDANDTADAETYAVTSAFTVVGSAPRLGYLLHGVSSPWGIGAGIALLAACLFLGWRAPARATDAEATALDDTAAPPADTPHRHAGRRTVGLIALAVIPLLGLGSASAPQSTIAYFSDTPTVSSTANGLDAAPWFTCGQGMATSATATSPFAYYPFSDAVGSTTATDATGGAPAVMGTAAGNYTFGGAQPCGRDGGTGVYFNGTTGYAGGPDVAGVGTLGNRWTTFTISAWFRSETTTTPGGLIGMSNAQNGTGGSHDRKLWLDTSGRVRFGVWAGTTAAPTAVAQRTIVSPGAVSYLDRKWHLATASLSPAGQKLYVDGELVASNPTVVTAFQYPSTPPLIGAYWTVGRVDGWSNGGGAWRGNISKVGVWGKALTDQQIRDLYRSALPLLN